MIVQAVENQLDIVRNIIQQTIDEIFPSYYAAGAVELFKQHHNDNVVLEDIKKGNLYLLEDEGEYAGTITINEDKLSRLFVLPQKQHKGFGKALLDFSEQKVSGKYSKIILEASLPAKKIYINRGYKVLKYDQVVAPNGDVICYDIMEKTITDNKTAIDYEGKIFSVVGNADNDINDNILFNCHQEGESLKADYSGGDIKFGFIVGQVSMNGELDFFYQHITGQNEICVGKCHGTPQINANGKIELHGKWQGLNSDCPTGESIAVEM